jgi:Na+/melibiose symporter-like transporter
VGMTALAVAMTAGVYLVIDAVVSQGWAIVMTVASTVVFVGLWLVVPLTGRYDRWDEHLDEEGVPTEEPAGR